MTNAWQLVSMDIVIGAVNMGIKGQRCVIKENGGGNRDLLIMEMN